MNPLDLLSSKTKELMVSFHEFTVDQALDVLGEFALEGATVLDICTLVHLYSAVHGQAALVERRRERGNEEAMRHLVAILLAALTKKPERNWLTYRSAAIAAWFRLSRGLSVAPINYEEEKERLEDAIRRKLTDAETILVE